MMSVTKRVTAANFEDRAEFGQVDAGENADRRRDQGGDANDQQAADDGIAQTAAFTAGCRGVLGEEIPAQGRETVIEQGPENPQQGEQAEGHGHHGQGDADAVDRIRAANRDSWRGSGDGFICLAWRHRAGSASGKLPAR
jgi:hypothetical protein